MIPAMRDSLASHTKADFGDECGVCIILPDVSTEELHEVLRFIYGAVDTYSFSTGQIWTKLLNMERVPRKLKITKRWPTLELFKGEEPTLKPSQSENSSSYDDFYEPKAFDDDADKISIPGSEIEAGAESPHHFNGNDGDGDGLVPSPYPLIDPESREKEGVSLWQCIIPNCHYVAPYFTSLSEHLNSAHPAEKISTLRCEICSKVYKNKSSLMMHTFGEDCQRIFGTHSKYKCAQCAVFFYSFRNLESHVNLNHLRVEESTLSYRWSIFTCEVCLRIFSRPENYYIHMKEKHGVRRDYFAEDFASIDLKYAWQQVCEEKEKLIDAAKYSGYITARKATRKGLFYCKICKIDFGTDNGLFRHIRHHHEGDNTYSCKKCHVDFPTKFLLFAHEKECKKKDATYQCVQCKAKFTTQKGLSNHLTLTHGSPRKVHEKVLLSNGSVRYKCDLCGVLLASNQAVKRHKDGVHADKSGPRKYVCNHDGCSYQTNVITNFTEHQRGHGPATHVCETCGLSYCHKDALHKHVAMFHPDPNGEALICEVCSKSFSNRFSLRNHKKSTHRSRDFACKLCEKKFKLKVALRQHMISHSDLRPWICDICNKSFKTKSKLQRHKKQTHCTHGGDLSV